MMLSSFLQFKGPEISEDDLSVAVKTCEKFHEDRGKYCIC